MTKDATGIKNGPPRIMEKPGWVEIKMPKAYNRKTNFLHGAGNARRLKIQYFKNEIDGAFLATVWFGPAAEGPPGHAHGGSIAAVCDEAMGLAVWINGFRAVSARIEIDYKKMIPIGTTAAIEIWIEKNHGRKVLAKGRIANACGTVYSEARGLFVTIDPARFGPLADEME